jgi:hypothetical protein
MVASRVARGAARHQLRDPDIRDRPCPFLSGRQVLVAAEVSTCSARSAARTNDVDTDPRREHHRRGREGPGEVRLLLEDGQRPAPAGEFAGDGGVGHDRSLVAGVEARPAGVQSAVGPLAAVPRARRGLVLPAAQLRAGPVAGAVVPGSFDQQPAGVAVAGLGDPPLGSGRPGGRLGGHQPQVGADRAAGQPGPVADLDRQPDDRAEPGRRGRSAGCGPEREVGESEGHSDRSC